ncbi:exodeoxyribonuclease VII small subunit [Slackia isoflavoniconvertens]|uniref:exodeoxyribonuclease VII small subunit n=1 Tax=Slackia isoflavoniconvertens TaxID=572010 RepID=UPI002E78887C|nr:exodeoxyribonuclease VII small subunit [Slackia isoflavoniconvertens]
MGLESLDREAFTQIRDRLDEIATQVRGDDMSLDAALDLYDEAVKLGMKATELLETLDASDSDAPSSEGAMQR